MKKKLVLLLIWTGIFVFGQNNQVTITGKIIYQKGKPPMFGHLTFENKADADFYKEVDADTNGQFSTQIPKGEYIITIQAENSFSTIEKNIQSDTDLGNITIESTIELSGVVADGEKPIYRIELDKRVYDMSRDLTTKGVSLSDALNNVPSVQVDVEGNVSVRGNEDVRVLIDGKPSSLTGVSSVADALRNIPADAVQRVEVVTNPSARYDAEGSAGIINIVLKKGQLRGFNGSFTAFTGHRPNTGFNASLNYRTEHFNYFFSPSFRYSDSRGESSFDNTFFYDNGIDTIETQHSERSRKKWNTMFMGGVEYNWHKKNTLTLSGNFRNSDGDNDNDINYKDFENEVLFGRSTRFEHEDEKDKSYEGSLAYRHEFDGEGHELNAQFISSYSTEDEIANIEEEVLMGDGIASDNRTANYEKQKRNTLQIDYVKPFANKARFEAGYKSEWMDNENDFSVDELEGTIWVNKPSFTDVVNFKQGVHTGYVQYGNKLGRFSFLSGLRIEKTDVTIESQNSNDGTGSYDEKNYTKLFPSLTLNYSLNEEETSQLQISYSKRIRRPWSRFLSPFSNYSDDRNVFQGNPDLDPTFTDSYELTYIMTLGKATISPAVFYQRTEDVMNVFRSQQVDDEGNNIFVSSPVNAGNEDRFGLEMVLSAPIFKFWRLSGNFNLFSYQQDGSYTDDDGKEFEFDGDGTSWFARMSNDVTLPYKANFQVRMDYRGKQKGLQGESKGRFSTDLALSKDLFKGNATLAFNVRDLFNTRKREMTNYGEGYISDVEMQWRQRQFNLSFTYRINQNKKRERGDREDMGGEDMGY